MTEQSRSDIYGSRARIGYTSPPLTTEVFPYEFYQIVPKGVTLVVTSLAIVGWIGGPPATFGAPVA